MPKNRCRLVPFQLIATRLRAYRFQRIGRHQSFPIPFPFIAGYWPSLTTRPNRTSHFDSETILESTPS